jgi:hypothetical protein
MQFTLRPQKQYVEIGDRIVVRSSRRELVRFVGKPGIVVAVFQSPRGSCMVRMDVEHGQPDLFVYQTEIAEGIKA